MSRDKWQPHTFTTPGGQVVTFALRKDTNDFNTVNSVMVDHDEYRIKGVDFVGVAFDIGCHIGSVAIALAVDNPKLHVIALEPVPGNAGGARHNAEMNAVAGRVVVIEGAAGDPESGPVRVEYDFTGTESAEHHAWIGNSTIMTGDDVTCGQSAVYAPWDLGAMIRRYGVPVYVKIDCEGGEYAYLADAQAVAQVPYIAGEWHPVDGNTRDDFAKLIEPTHDVEWDGPLEGPGNFFAHKRR